MHSKSFAAPLFLLALMSFVNAGGVLVTPGLGVPSNPQESDIKQPTQTGPCGSGVDIAKTIGTADCVAPDASGNYQFSISNFGAPRTISKVQVDPKGTGSDFTLADIVTNGDGATGNGQQNITIRLPSGTQCDGTNNRCLVSFTASDGTGNCAVVSQPPTNTTKTDDASPTPTPIPHGQAGDAPKAGPSPIPNSQGTVSSKGQEAGDVKGKGNTDANGNPDTSDNESTGVKGNTTSTSYKGLKREHVQGKRLWASR